MTVSSNTVVWRSNDQTVALTRDNRGIAELTLHRADKHNAFNAEVIEALIEALALTAQDRTLRAVLLRGEGKHFSAGADLNWMRTLGQADFESNLQDAGRLACLMQALDTLPKPTAVLVQGAAYGGALGLIACCDFAVALPDARFCLSEVRLGLIPAVISPYVQRSMGHRHTRAYAVSAEVFDAEAACKSGLVHEIHTPDQALARAREWLELTLGNGPEAMAAAKGLLRELAGDSPETDAIEKTTAAIAERRLSTEGQEGLSAFLEKRTPSWRAPS